MLIQSMTAYGPHTRIAAAMPNNNKNTGTKTTSKHISRRCSAQQQPTPNTKANHIYHIIKLIDRMLIIHLLSTRYPAICRTGTDLPSAHPPITTIAIVEPSTSKY